MLPHSGFSNDGTAINKGIKRGSIPLCKAGGHTAHALPVPISSTSAPYERFNSIL